MACWHRQSGGAQIISRRLTGPSIRHNFKRDFLSLVQSAHPGAFDGAYVHKDILAAVIRLDETKAFLDVEPLYGSLRHETLLSDRSFSDRAITHGFIDRELEEDRHFDASGAAKPSRSAETRSWTDSARLPISQAVLAVAGSCEACDRHPRSADRFAGRAIKIAGFDRDETEAHGARPSPSD
jgi:hypothetical protein